MEREAIRQELLTRFCKRCNGNILCGHCKHYRRALMRGKSIKPIDCLADVAVDMITEAHEKKV